MPAYRALLYKYYHPDCPPDNETFKEYLDNNIITVGWPPLKVQSNGVLQYARAHSISETARYCQNSGLVAGDITIQPSFRAWIFLAKAEPGNIIVARYSDGRHKICVVESRLDAINALAIPNAVKNKIDQIYNGSFRDLSFGMHVRSCGLIMNHAVNDKLNDYWSRRSRQRHALIDIEIYNPGNDFGFTATHV